MRLLHHKGFVLFYWVLAFAAAVAGLILGGTAGVHATLGFADDSGVSAGGKLITTGLGALLGAAVAIALFAAVWMALWALDRRANPQVDDDDYDSIDALHDVDDDDLPHDELDDDIRSDNVRSDDVRNDDVRHDDVHHDDVEVIDTVNTVDTDDVDGSSVRRGSGSSVR